MGLRIPYSVIGVAVIDFKIIFVEKNLNKSGLHYVFTALLWRLCLHGGGFRAI